MAESSNQSSQQSSHFDVDVQQIAAVYAQAFLGAAQSKGTIAAQIEELEWLAELLTDHPDLERLISSLLIHHEERVQILQRVLGDQVSQDLLVFLNVLSRHGRLGLVRPIAREARKRYNQMQGKVEVHVATASPLGEPLRLELAASLRQLLRAEPLIDFRNDPKLLGGVLVRVGDRVYDGSLATRLGRLRKQMLDGAVEHIQDNHDAFLSGV